MSKTIDRIRREISRASRKLKSKKTEQIKQDIQFIDDEKFVVEYTRLTLAGFDYFVPKYASDRPAVKNLLNGSLFEPETHELVREFCKIYKGSMVHAGTFFGDMIPSFSRSVSGSVYAFEPVFENYILAKLCVDANGLSNVILMNSALSENVGNLYIDTNEGDGSHAGGCSSIADTGNICAAINIDSLNIEDLVLIQLDVEGHELAALTGARATIQKCRPVIAVEDNSNNCSGLLESLQYENVAQTPDLTIWVPTENEEYKQKIISIVS